MPTGEGTYTREVIRHLIKLFPEDHFFVVVPEHIALLDAPNAEQIIYRKVDGIAARIRYAFEVGSIAKKYRLDLFHNLTNYILIGASCPIVTNVMDLVTLKYPEVRSSPLHGWIYRYLFPILLRLSHRLVVISESTGQDVCRYYGLGDRVRVIPCGIDHERFNNSMELNTSLLERFNIPPNYLLFVGYLSPKKNLNIVLRAMHQLSRQGFDTWLVLVGKRGYGSDTFFSLAAELGLTDRLIETGFVSDEELTLLYRHAGLFVFPSIYEGFGLPVVEAMACGTPVLISNTGPLPELVDDPNYLANPHDVDRWAEGICLALTDSGFRERAQKEGHDRAQLFSWDKSARQIHAVYAEFIEESIR